MNKKRAVVKELTQAGVDKLSVSSKAHNKSIYVLEFVLKAKLELETEVIAVAVSEVVTEKIIELVKNTWVSMKVKQYLPYLRYRISGAT